MTRVGRANLVPFEAVSYGLLAIEASAEFRANRLGFLFAVKGDIDRLKIPAQLTPRRADRLWEHTCFEAFIGEDGSRGYYEFNFSPSGEWAAYAFRDYREAVAIAWIGSPPAIIIQRTAQELVLQTSIDFRELRLGAARSVRMGLSAVIESDDAALSYWALRHPASKPDFHHPDCFALELTLPGACSQ